MPFRTLANMLQTILRIFKRFWHFWLWNFFPSVSRCFITRFSLLRDVDSGTPNSRLYSSRLFYQIKFSIVVHTKCSFTAFCMNYQAEFIEVKQASKRDESSLKSRVSTLSMLILRSAARVNRKKIGFKKIHKEIAFYPNRIFFAEVHYVKYRIRWGNKTLFCCCTSARGVVILFNNF